MQENIIWLVNAMVEQGKNVVELCVNNNVVALIANQLTPDKQERVINSHNILTLTDIIANSKHVAGTL